MTGSAKEVTHKGIWEGRVEYGVWKEGGTLPCTNEVNMEINLERGAESKLLRTGYKMQWLGEQMDSPPDKDGSCRKLVPRGGTTPPYHDCTPGGNP